MHTLLLFTIQDMLCEVLLFFLRYALNTFCESKSHVVWHGLQRLAFCYIICCPVFRNQTFHKQNFKEQVFKILSHYFLYTTRAFGGMWWCSWLGYCVTSRKVAGSFPNGAIGVFHWHTPGHSMALGLTQPLTEMSTRNISCGVKAAGS